MRKVLLVTGGGRGIGAATCILAAQKGWAVAVNYTANARAADEVVAQINTDVAKILNSAEIKNKFFENGLEPSYANPEDFERWIRRETARWAKVIREQNVTVD